MRGRQGLISLIVGVALLAAPAAAHATVPALGVNDGAMRMSATDTRMQQLATAAQSLGSNQGVPFRIWRMELAWSDVQAGSRVNPPFNWSLYDRIYAVLRQHGIEPLWIVTRAPPWARNRLDPCGFGQSVVCPPGDSYLGYWRAFVQAVVLRYPESAGIEVWNEPNINKYWGTFVNPSRYARVLNSAYQGVQDAKQRLRPSMPAGWNVPVLLGGPADPADPSRFWRELNATDWLNAVYDTGEPRFDALSVHISPFPQDRPPDRSTPPFVDLLARVAAVRDTRGDSATPLWLTEIGYHTVGDTWSLGDPATPAQQGQNLRCAYGLSIDSPFNVAVFIINGLVDSSASPTDQEDSFGLLANDLSYKASPPGDGYSILQSYFSSVPAQVSACG